MYFTNFTSVLPWPLLWSSQGGHLAMGNLEKKLWMGRQKQTDSKTVQFVKWGMTAGGSHIRPVSSSSQPMQVRWAGRGANLGVHQGDPMGVREGDGWDDCLTGYLPKGISKGIFFGAMGRCLSSVNRVCRHSVVQVLL